MKDIFEEWGISIASLAVLIGGVAWLTSLYTIAVDNQKNLSTLQEQTEGADTKFREKIGSVEDRLARIETKLDMILERSKFR